MNIRKQRRTKTKECKRQRDNMSIRKIFELLYFLTKIISSVQMWLG